MSAGKCPGTLPLCKHLVCDACGSRLETSGGTALAFRTSSTLRWKVGAPHEASRNGMKGLKCWIVRNASSAERLRKRTWYAPIRTQAFALNCGTALQQKYSITRLSSAVFSSLFVTCTVGTRGLLVAERSPARMPELLEVAGRQCSRRDSPHSGSSRAQAGNAALFSCTEWACPPKGSQREAMAKALASQKRYVCPRWRGPKSAKNGS